MIIFVIDLNFLVLVARFSFHYIFHNFYNFHFLHFSLDLSIDSTLLKAEGLSLSRAHFAGNVLKNSQHHSIIANAYNGTVKSYFGFSSIKIPLTSVS